MKYLPLNIFRMSNIVSLGILISVIKHRYCTHEVQHFSSWQDPQIPLGVRTSIPVTVHAIVKETVAVLCDMSKIKFIFSEAILPYFKF